MAQHDPDHYDPEDLSCVGCSIRTGNLLYLLDGILKAAKHFQIVRDDLTLEEFTGPLAIQVLRDMETL